MFLHDQDIGYLVDKLVSPPFNRHLGVMSRPQYHRAKRNIQALVAQVPNFRIEPVERDCYEFE